MLLATFKREPDKELRLSWAEYEGTHYLAARYYKRSANGKWEQLGRQFTIRPHELVKLAEVVNQTIDLAGQRAKNKRGWYPGERGCDPPPDPELECRCFGDPAELVPVAREGLRRLQAALGGEEHPTGRPPSGES